MKQSFAWWSFQKSDDSDNQLLSSAASIGYAGVELLPVELFQNAADLGLRIVTHGGHQSIGSGLNDLSQHDRIRKELDANLELAVKFSISNLIVFSGNRREYMTDSQGLENTVIGLRELAPLAEQAGVTLILELLNSVVDHPGYQCDTSQFGATAVRQTQSSHVGLLYDIYHMRLMQQDVLQDIADYSDIISHYHTAGVPGRTGSLVTDELNYNPVFSAIADSGYGQFIGHEFIPIGNNIEELKNAYTLCAQY